MINKFPSTVLTLSTAYIFLASFFEASTWNEFPSYMSTGSDIIMALAAVYGVSLWKKQIKFNRKHDFADRILDLSDEFVAAMNYARNPFSIQGELENEVEEIKSEAEDHHKLVIARLLTNDKSRLELLRMKKKVRRHFGGEAAQLVENLISTNYELRDKFEKMSRIKQRLKVGTHTVATIEELNTEYDELGYNLTGIRDEFEKRLERNLTDLDKRLNAYVN